MRIEPRRIRDFSETEIRKAILAKAPLGNINKNTPHWKGYIFAGDKLVGKVKIPNAHKRIMHGSKSVYIARDLKLNETQFNCFVECSLSSGEYMTLLTKLA
jgi:hypothetical protein